MLTVFQNVHMLSCPRNVGGVQPPAAQLLHNEAKIPSLFERVGTNIIESHYTP